MADYGKIAAAIHKAMCNDSRFGYTMSANARQGQTGKGYLEGTTDGVKWKVKVGDYDCSSSVIAAWKAALANTKYAKALDGATYTGNIESVFVKSGLFVAKPMSFLAEPGDLYLKAGAHVAMCQTQKPDVLSEFSINEKGGAYGGKVGDQTGREAYVHAYYNYPWKNIIHYNGKLDTKTTTTPAKTTTPTKTTTSTAGTKVVAKLIDVSKHNGQIDWAKVKAAGYHAILRCGYGDNLTSQDDAQWTRNYKECERLGIPYGVYFYSYAKTDKQINSEIAHAKRLLKGRKLSYPVYFDSEEPGTQKVAGKYAKKFCDAMEKAGFWAGIYASESWWKSYLQPVVGNRYTKWIAKYGTNTGKPQTKPTVVNTDIWQYSSKGKVSGVSGNVDVNYAYRDLVKAVTKKKAPY